MHFSMNYVYLRGQSFIQVKIYDTLRLQKILYNKKKNYDQFINKEDHFNFYCHFAVNLVNENKGINKTKGTVMKMLNVYMMKNYKS